MQNERYKKSAEAFLLSQPPIPIIDVFPIPPPDGMHWYKGKKVECEGDGCFYCIKQLKADIKLNEKTSRKYAHGCKRSMGLYVPEVDPFIKQADRKKVQLKEIEQQRFKKAQEGRKNNAL